MNIFYSGTSAITFPKTGIRFAGLILTSLLAGSLAGQVQNPDAITLFDRSSIGGTAANAGSCGAYSSVGGNLSGMSLNPAGLGLYKTSDISITPGLRVAHDQSTYDGSSMNANHTIGEFAQAGAVFTKNIHSKTSAPGSGSFGLKSISIGINYQTDNSFDRSQNFNYLNTSGSLVNKYAALSNYYGTNQWSIESVLLGASGILGQNASGQYTSNVKTPVQQSGNLSTNGGTNKISLGLGGNIDDKIFFGFSLAVPILNYTVNATINESNPIPNDTATYFQNYQLQSSVSESGVGVTGNLGLIFKPVSWFRFGISYTLPTWYFMSENYNGNLFFSNGDSTTGELSADPYSYKIRTPMKGTIGASFYLNENSFISADYELQNIGATHYTLSDDSAGLFTAQTNGYIKQTYTYSHTLRVGIQGAIKKLRLRAGYSYTNSPFKSGQNYTASQYNQAMQSFTLGLGLKFKVFYMDLAYVLTYSRDGVSPDYIIPLDQINSTYMTHTALLTLGVRIPSKGGDNSSTPSKKQRSSDQLPRYIDPGDKY